MKKGWIGILAYALGLQAVVLITRTDMSQVYSGSIPLGMYYRSLWLVMCIGVWSGMLACLENDWRYMKYNLCRYKSFAGAARRLILRAEGYVVCIYLLLFACNLTDGKIRGKEILFLMLRFLLHMLVTGHVGMWLWLVVNNVKVTVFVLIVAETAAGIWLQKTLDTGMWILCAGITAVAVIGSCMAAGKKLIMRKML